MIKENKIHIIRLEDILAVLMILPSVWVTSPSEYYYMFNGNLVISKHTTALMLIVLFAIFTALYENRIQRIIDTIKSGVKIPAVTIQDQLIHLWKTKFRILQVIRDYLPFLVCIIAYHRLTEIIPHIKKLNFNNIFMSVDQAVVENIRLYVLNKLGSSGEFRSFLALSYKTYFLSVPILAIYIYMIRDLKKFRSFLLSIVIASIMSLIVCMLIPCSSLEAITKQIKMPLMGCVSIAAVYTTIVWIFSRKVNKAVASLFLPIAILFFISEILSYYNYLLAILISIPIGLLATYLARLIQGENN